MFRRKKSTSSAPGRPSVGHDRAARPHHKRPGEGGPWVIRFGLGFVIATGMTMWMVAVAMLLGLDAKSYISFLL